MQQFTFTSSESFAVTAATPGYTTDLKPVEVATTLLSASGRLEKYGGKAGARINPVMLFDVRQSLIGVFLIVNKLKSFRENLSATLMIYRQTLFALELIRNWPEDEHLGATRNELRKIADGLAFAADVVRDANRLQGFV
jgi:hypothetical protein